MPGLSLGNYGGGGGFTATAAGASPATSGSTATQQAYGTASGNGPCTAKNGTIIAGVAGTLVLLFLWYTLPN